MNKQEWSLIIDAAVKQHNQAKIVSRNQQQLKKIQYRKALQQQIDNRKGKNDFQKQQDLHYYESIVQSQRKAQAQQKSKHEEARLRRLQMNAQNNKLLQKLNDQHHSLQNSENHFQEQVLNIGLKSSNPNQKKFADQKKRLIQFYKQQQQTKKRKAQDEKLMDLSINQKLKQALDQQQKKRTVERQRTLRFRQNQSVYQIYNKIHQEELQKEKAYFQRMIKKPMDQRLQALKQREESQKIKKQANSLTVRQTILDQIEQHKNRPQNQTPAGEEGLRIGMEKVYGYNKQEYIDYWKRQMQQKKRRQQNEKFMTEKERRLNLRQIQNAEQGKLGNGYSPLYIGKKL